MGACVSTHHKPSASARNMEFSYPSNHTNLLVPLSPTKPIINADLPLKPQSAASFRDFGSKEEKFFDSQAWLESDCDEDFMSVNGDLTPSKGSTPVHHNFSVAPRGVYSLDNNKPPNAPEKKTRLSDLFKQSLRDDLEVEPEDVSDETETKHVSGEMETKHVSGEMDGVKPKRTSGCFPSLLSSCSSSTNGRKKKMSPSPSLNPVAG